MSNFTTSFASEIAQYIIRVNAIAPGRIKKALMKTTTPEFETSLLKNIPLGRMGLTEDIGNAILFLVSHMSRYNTDEIPDVSVGFFID